MDLVEAIWRILAEEFATQNKCCLHPPQDDYNRNGSILRPLSLDEGRQPAFDTDHAAVAGGRAPHPLPHGKAVQLDISLTPPAR